jgi:hypothetical protein
MLILRNSYLTSGANPKINRFSDKSTKTELILCSLDANRIAEKKIALSDVEDLGY